MKYKLHFNKKNLGQALLLLSLFCSVSISCQQKSDTELMDRLNGVLRQIQRQGNISDEERLAIASLYESTVRVVRSEDFEPKNMVLLKDVSYAPVFLGCEGLLQEDAKACFNESLSMFIEREFDEDVLRILDLQEPKQVKVFFIIDEKGKLSAIKIKGKELVMQGEIIRILEKMPTMEPAVHNDIKVPVLCSVLVTCGSEVKAEVLYMPVGLKK